jgi:Xaa-Pro aminopeptidase
MTSAGVYQDRIERAQAAMRAAGVDLLFVGPSSDLVYLTGIHAHLSERLNLLALPGSGKPSFVVPRLEAPNVADKSDLVDIASWEETESPADIVAALAGSANSIAVGDQLHAAFLLRLQEAIPVAKWSQGGPLLRELRMRKDAAEIAAMREVARRTDKAWAAFLEAGPIQGLSERQAMDRLSDLMKREGIAPMFGICGSGPNSAAPHYNTGDRVIEAGDAVVFDFGGELDGYLSDLTRTVVIGEPSDEYRKVYDIVLRANQAAFAAVKPGAPCEEIDRAARDLIAAEGYGEYFIHRVGHGLGMDVHEDPYLVSGNTMPLAPGMVFSDEPGIYIGGKFGIRIEDTVVCTEDGADRINATPHDLIVMD